MIFGSKTFLIEAQVLSLRWWRGGREQRFDSPLQCTTGRVI